MAQVARALDIKPGVVYHWADCGHLPTRRGPAGRKYVHFTSEIEAACRQRVFRSAHLRTAVKTQAPTRHDRRRSMKPPSRRSQHAAGSTIVIAIPSLAFVKGWHTLHQVCGAGVTALLAQGGPPHPRPGSCHW